MTYYLEDKVLIAGIEAKIAYIDSSGRAYLTPLKDDLDNSYHGSPILVGLVFTRLNSKGIDYYNNQAFPIVQEECQAV